MKLLGKTDVGRKRDHNEDSFMVDDKHKFAIVADGMGGHAAGEVASELVIEKVSDFLKSIDENNDITWPYRYDTNFSVEANKLIVGIKLSNEVILKQVKQNPKLTGMGTTIVSAIFKNGLVTIGHVGDSRAYLFRKGQLSIITDDHSWVSEQVRRGMITEEQARVHPMKNVVTQALGGGERLTVDINEFQLEVDDIVMLCSDGLNSMVPHVKIEEIFKGEYSSQNELCDNLIKEANDAGGEDNITVVLGKY